MDEDEIEERLRSMMARRARAVDPGQVDERLAVPALRVPVPAGRPAAASGHRPLLAPILAAAAVAVVAAGVALGLHAGAEPDPRSTASTRPVVAGGTRAPVTVGPVLLVHNSDGDETWIPADRSQTWLYVSRSLGSQRARCAAFRDVSARTTLLSPPLTPPPVSPPSASQSNYPQIRDRIVGSSSVPSCSQGDWSHYRPAFAAALPDEPAQVLDSLRRASAGHRDRSVVDTAFDYIASGWVDPSAVRKIAAAVALLPDAHVAYTTDGARTITYALPGAAAAFYRKLVIDTLDRVIGTGRVEHGRPRTTEITYADVAALGARY